MKVNARYVSIGDFDDLYFQVSFKNQHPAADYDPSAPIEPSYSASSRAAMAGSVTLRPTIQTALPGTSGFSSSSSLPLASPSRLTGQSIAPWR
jgi:hypothetical protein